MINKLKYKGYTGSVDVDFKEKIMSGKVLHLNDIVTYQGENPKALEESFKAAIDEYLEFCLEVGKKPEKAFSGTFNVRIDADLHKQAAQRATIEGVSLNHVVAKALYDYLNGSRNRGEIHNNYFVQLPGYKLETGETKFFWPPEIRVKWLESTVKGAY